LMQFACENQHISAVSLLRKIKPVEENQKTLLGYAVQETKLGTSKVWDCTLQNMHCMSRATYNNTKF
jgi:hypothetical protein